MLRGCFVRTRVEFHPRENKTPAQPGEEAKPVRIETRGADPAITGEPSEEQRAGAESEGHF
jgi:hypothetical protein